MKELCTVVWAESREQTRASLALKRQGEKSITRTKRELEAIKKGLPSGSCCHGARWLHDPEQGGDGGNIPTCPPSPPASASHWLTLLRGQLARSPRAEVSLLGYRTDRKAESRSEKQRRARIAGSSKMLLDKQQSLYFFQAGPPCQGKEPEPQKSWNDWQKLGSHGSL